MKLEDYLYKQKEKKDILLMTHIVIGYPTLAKSSEIVSAMVNAGADLIELQIPSSEPIADGPVIRDANRKALAGGVRVQNCIDFAADVVSRFDIPFLFMCYYDVLFKFGLKRFTQTMADHGIRGAIVPDIPPEEGSDYLKAMASHDLAPISIFTPSMPLERMQRLSDCGRGFIYCVAREGVTGSDTEFSAKLDQYLQLWRQKQSGC